MPGENPKTLRRFGKANVMCGRNWGRKGWRVGRKRHTRGTGVGTNWIQNQATGAYNTRRQRKGREIQASGTVRKRKRGKNCNEWSLRQREEWVFAKTGERKGGKSHYCEHREKKGHPTVGQNNLSLSSDNQIRKRSNHKDGRSQKKQKQKKTKRSIVSASNYDRKDHVQIKK